MAGNLIILAGVALSYFKIIDYENAPSLNFIASGNISVLPELSLVFGLVLVLFCIIDFTLIGSMHEIVGIVTFILSSLSTQNWILGAIFGILSFMISSITGGMTKKSRYG